MKRWKLSLPLLVISIFFIQPPTLHAATVRESEFPWVKSIGTNELQICGSNKIVPTENSIRRHFHVGADGLGYLTTGLPSIEMYFQILTKFPLVEAKAELQKLFSNAELWVVKKNATVATSLGTPKQIDLPFTASVRDCMEGAKTTLGNDCSKNKGSNLISCCREKFIGPEVIWGEASNYRLYYSPDPSVSLKVAGEATHRYCNVAQPMKVKLKK